MNSQTPTPSPRPLTTKQLQILTILYKFRFITASLIASSQTAKHKRVILARLKILEDQDYIAKNYDKSYKLLGKPASYYLLPKGIRALRLEKFADEKVLKRIYYDKNQNDVHITHRLNVFKAYVYLKQYYPDQFTFYSKTELSTWKYVPKNLTDAYLKTKPGKTEKKPNNSPLNSQTYFVSFIEPSLKNWQINNTLNRYIKYAESEIWQQATKQDFPDILLICDNQSHAQRLQKLADQALQGSWASLKFTYMTLS